LTLALHTLAPWEASVSWDRHSDPKPLSTYFKFISKSVWIICCILISSDCEIWAKSGIGLGEQPYFPLKVHPSKTEIIL
jgi:hypothetical protein